MQLMAGLCMASHAADLFMPLLTSPLTVLGLISGCLFTSSSNKNVVPAIPKEWQMYRMASGMDRTCMVSTGQVTMRCRMGHDEHEGRRVISA